MIALLVEIEDQVEVVAGDLRPIAHRVRLRKIGHLGNTRDRGSGGIVHGVGASSTDHGHEPGCDRQEQQNDPEAFHIWTKSVGILSWPRR